MKFCLALSNISYVLSHFKRVILDSQLFTYIVRGTEEYFGYDGHVDMINSTLGKPLGGAAGK